MDIGKCLWNYSNSVIHVGGSSFTQHYDDFEELVQADKNFEI